MLRDDAKDEDGLSRKGRDRPGLYISLYVLTFTTKRGALLQLLTYDYPLYEDLIVHIYSEFSVCKFERSQIQTEAIEFYLKSTQGQQTQRELMKRPHMPR